MTSEPLVAYKVFLDNQDLGQEEARRRLAKVQSFLDWLKDTGNDEDTAAYQLYLEDEQQLASTTVTKHLEEIESFLAWKTELEKINTQGYVVGIGASAGGLEALERFFGSPDVSPDLAYVVIQHLSADFKSMMPEILARVTDLPIKVIENYMTILPGHIYLNNPRSEIKIQDDKFIQESIADDSFLHLPINSFLKSLANEKKDKAVAVILSGTGRDGSLGVVSIQEKGGLIIAQDAASAVYPSMPESAALHGPAHLVLNPVDMAAAINTYVQTKILPMQQKMLESSVTGENAYSYLLSLLQREYGIDFAQYKDSTLLRRIERRMNLANMPNMEDYAISLQDNPDDLDALYRDMLVDVTSFFRDDEAFNALQTLVVPAVISKKSDGDMLRLWVAACASGEEAYSIAMLFQEEIERQNKDIELKVFATDAHKGSILRASLGNYDQSKLTALPEAFLHRYFEKHADGYTVKKALRQKIIFAPHNLLSDSGFSNLDFVSCRNMLIYLKPEAQMKILHLFSNGLRLDGILFLGSSEHLGILQDHYDPISEKWRIYKKVRSLPLGQHSMSRLIPRLSSSSASVKGGKSASWERDLIKTLVKSGFVVDSHGQLLEIIGEARHFLKLKAGRANLTLGNLLEEPLASVVKTGLFGVHSSSEPLSLTGIEVEPGEPLQEITIIPFESQVGDANVRHYLIDFKPEEEGNTKPSLELTTMDVDRVVGLERELEFTRESLQASLEELETSNEELQSTNEELLASNEELQSTNEELSSVNEELITVNAEFQAQNKRLNQSNNDLENLLKNSKTIAIFLGKDMLIRMITPAASELFGLLPSDVGRPISHFSTFLHFGHRVLEDLCEEALQGTQTTRLVSLEDKRLELTVLPYETPEEEFDGIILSFADVTGAIQETVSSFKVELETLKHLGLLFPGIFSYYDMIEERALYASKDEGSLLGYAPGVVQTKNFGLLNIVHPDDLDFCRSKLDEIRDADLDELIVFDYRLRNQQGEWKWFRTHAMPVSHNAEGKVHMLLSYRKNVDAVKLLELGESSDPH
ncbi:MAG: PAS domain-containing protein [Trueperaceae bacterium]|nr:PAS domain-containing protein [Trueperaceae bacterium]